MIVGGKGKKSVEYLHFLGEPSVEDCHPFADAPFETTDSIILKDHNGRPMICGGKMNPRPNSCYVHHMARNTWTKGPNLEQERVGATAACLKKGVCWVFGGISRLSTHCCYMKLR